MLTIGKSIRKYRTALELAQRELADEASISVPFLSQIENGHRDPSPDVLKRLASVLQVPIQLILLDAIDFSDVEDLTDAQRRKIRQAQRIAEAYVA